MPEQTRVPHSLSLDEREKFVATGVSEVIRFDDNTVILITSCGKLTIKGVDIKVVSLDIDSADKSVRLEGSFSSFEYGRHLGSKKGTVAERLFG